MYWTWRRGAAVLLVVILSILLCFCGSEWFLFYTTSTGAIVVLSVHFVNSIYRYFQNFFCSDNKKYMMCNSCLTSAPFGVILHLYIVIHGLFRLAAGRSRCAGGQFSRSGRRSVPGGFPNIPFFERMIQNGKNAYGCGCRHRQRACGAV